MSAAAALFTDKLPPLGESSVCGKGASTMLKCSLLLACLSCQKSCQKARTIIMLLNRFDEFPSLKSRSSFFLTKNFSGSREPLEKPADRLRDPVTGRKRPISSRSWCSWLAEFGWVGLCSTCCSGLRRVIHPGLMAFVSAACSSGGAGIRPRSPLEWKAIRRPFRVHSSALSQRKNRFKPLLRNWPINCPLECR